jgi:hypothetical protein
MSKFQKKYFFFLTLFWQIFQLNAQNNTVASGNNASGTTGSISYSIGQVNYVSSSNSNAFINQGVQQPFEIITILGTSAFEDINDAIITYPNPVVYNLNLEINNISLNGLRYELYDINGKILGYEKVKNIKNNIEMLNYPVGIYFLKVLKNRNEIKSFKIIKNK